MATIGCPLMDMGAALGYWVEASDDERLKNSLLSHFQRGYTRLNLQRPIVKYEIFPHQNLSFYIAYGRWRIAVILQRIYARYKMGLTTDERLCHFGRWCQNVGTSYKTKD